MVHVHSHFEYSPLDGMGRVREMFEQAKKMGQHALAITDHGTSAGHWEAQQVADELGMKAILGQEFYYIRENDDKTGHLLVIAKNDVGLRNLYRMQEIAWREENFYRKPRINWDILKEHNEGLIVTSACLGSPMNQMLINGEYVEAKAWARKFKDVFKDDFYIEIQPNDIPEQDIANKGSIRIARELDIQIVATNDVHYVYETDVFPHEVLLAMQTKKKMSDEKRFIFPDTNFWLKSEEEMIDTFKTLDKDIVREGLDTTLEIADKCDVRIKTGRYLPEYYDKGEKSARKLLVDKVMKGAKEKGYSKNKEYMGDVQHEINVIDEEGYSDYFLIVEDYINSARDNGVIVGDGRGSGSGSKVGYLTDIHSIQPDEYDLLFERFMAHGREPDIDTDFSDQDAVFHDLQQKYGHDSVARIATYGRMTPRACIRKVLNTFGTSQKDIKLITELVPELCPSLEEAYKVSPKLLDYKKKFKEEWEVIERLENVISHVGKHAGGVVIYPNLQDYVPIMTDSKDRSKRVVAYDMDMIHDIGFFKFDILGLETVKDIKRCLDSIEHTTGKRIDLTQINYEDSKVYDMLCEGDVSGIFQVNAQATKVMEQKPRNFRDLIAINALIRPGIGDWEEYIARRKGKEWTTYEPRMEYMQETEGIITYQEQFLLDANKLAGWEIAYADKHIRKNRDIRNDDELRRKFVNDCTDRGHEKGIAEGIWEEIEDAVDGGYSFNKSHSASYARLSFQTAYLKVHYPEHFYASLMSGEKTDGDGQDAIAGYIAEAKQRGIKISPPDINNSGESFIVNNNAINYRITTIKHVGNSAIKHIRSLRPISSFEDFMERREKRHIKKNVMINLIKAGCFDFDNPKREELLWKFDMEQRTKTQVKNGVMCDKYEIDDLTYMEWEKEVLGMYLSEHPMERYSFKSLEEYPDGGYALQGGEVQSIFEFHPKKDPARPKMAFVTLNSLYGSVKLVVFPQVWNNEANKECFVEGNIILVRGKRQSNDVLVDSVEKLQ